MNMKPGELGRVIDHPSTRRIGMVDAIIKTISIHENFRRCLAWEFEGRKPVDPATNQIIEVIPDSMLRPLGNPGEDETDEVLIRVGKPKEVVNV